MRNLRRAQRDIFYQFWNAKLKRLNLLRKNNQPANIIARDWNRELHKTANISGVDDDSLLGVLQNRELYERISQGAIAIAKDHNEETFMNSRKQILD